MISVTVINPTYLALRSNTTEIDFANLDNVQINTKKSNIKKNIKEG